MSMDLSKVRKNVEIYVKRHLPQYEVLETRRKSSHPDDHYLYMVSAKNTKDGTYAVWTAWNESTQSLNHGHYALDSIEDCEKIFAEYQNIRPYYEVYKYSQNVRSRLFVTDIEESAKNFCESHQWELADEHEFVWGLDYCEITE